jgi:hypothetical protein
MPQPDMPLPEPVMEGVHPPHPGVKSMPRWEWGKLHDAPRFGLRQLPLLLGPGLVMGAAAIGGGEWLTGPVVTARYGGALLWLATVSIFCQVIYNIEISRYTLYCGEPIFSGKFRLWPGPVSWAWVYVLLDFGSVLPYGASNAAVPLAAMYLRRIPDLKDPADDALVKGLGIAIFLVLLVPMLFGGKVYRSLKLLMTFKLVVVLGFLMILALGFSTWDTWQEILSGFVRFGTVPVNGDDGTSAGVQNVFAAWWSGTPRMPIDLSLLGFIAGMAAIAGNGGLTNIPISNFTREQGWGMGKEVGAIPSIIGGQNVELSHVGKVFPVDAAHLPRWRGWIRHIHRDQMLVWLPACFLGMALPSMLSVQFLPRGVDLADKKWQAAAMTADGVAEAVSPTLADGTTSALHGAFWMMTLFCGFLVLGTSGAMTADGVLRRWVDVAWTASARMRKWNTRDIGRFYFLALCLYAAGGVLMMLFVKPDKLLVYATTMYNVALGVSSWHVLFVNRVLLPPAIRPSWPRCVGLALGGTFFLTIAALTIIDTFKLFK